jgi:thiamine transport system ATP-binding protein
MLTVEGLIASYEGAPLLRHVDLAVADDEIVALVGPSGSGKSTLLRIIAGVQRADAGVIRWDGADISALPAHRRRIGLVFQDALLFPNLTVAANITFGAPDADVAAWLALVDMEGFERRMPHTLSGGEAQRIALVRALAPAPRLLLLDEPFSALDRDLRDRLAIDVRALLTSTGTPAIHVTHDLGEAAVIGDRVVQLVDLQRGATDGRHES